jgi:hypothetical protein
VVVSLDAPIIHNVLEDFAADDSACRMLASKSNTTYQFNFILKPYEKSKKT